MWKRLAAGAVAIGLSTFFVAPTDALPEVLSLKIWHIHTNEKATIVFKRNGVYDKAGLTQLNTILRDWRKDQPINMDPHLFDLLWQVYRLSGSHDYIHIVCGYRSPATNGMLRHRSKGVAENSLHMQGKAIDFFIPDVPLPKLREIGLRMEVGGVGFYPTSGSPFVHMDTGTPRHWPRMTHDQLVKVFPNGRTLYIPSDGKPLPGYAVALAEYKARKASGGSIATIAPIEVASADTKPARNAVATSAPLQLASADSANDEDQQEDDAIAAVANSTDKAGVAVAAYDTAPIPLPNLAPRHLAAIALDANRLGAPAIVAAALRMPAQSAPSRPAFAVIASAETRSSIAPNISFDSEQNWSSPAVPAALAKAMAERDQVRRGSSLPIPPTAVVATIDVSRPLRAEAITTAVLRSSSEAIPSVPQVLAYAAEPEPELAPLARARTARVTAFGGVPLPQLRPRPDQVRTAALRAATQQQRPHMEAPELTMTSLDTQGLRMWMAPQSTRQKGYALFTMPDFAQMPNLMDKPAVTFGAGFGRLAYTDLRTDRFSGALVQQPQVVDLTSAPQIASAR